MNDMNNKATRMGLVERYLEAETSPEEERLLAGFYNSCKADGLSEEEKAVRLLILGTHGEDAAATLEPSADKEQEYDRLMKTRAVLSVRWKTAITTAAIGLAAAVALALFLPVQPRPESSRPQFSATVPEKTYQPAVPVQTQPTITEVAEGKATTIRMEKREKACPKRESAEQSDKNTLITDIGRLYLWAGELFPDCEKIEMERKGDAMLLTTTRADGSQRFYIMTEDATGKPGIQITALAETDRQSTY